MFADPKVAVIRCTGAGQAATAPLSYDVSPIWQGSPGKGANEVDDLPAVCFIDVLESRHWVFPLVMT